ncbi:MAG TPA: EthD family reductase [Caulobacteraceae bacterium]|jgi:uncharacterized protein (TIGR02118 family)|nr:EthD family reductase [Caulobacteraceae bacterium]
MYKLLALYLPPADPDHFRRYYENHHMPLARALPGLLAHSYSFSPEGMGAPSPYFCVFEGAFANRAAFEAAVASDIGRKTAADVANYATGGVTLLHYEVTTG